jgi:hypothetical protein
MTKTALQAAKTKAAFQWDPDNDQTFNGTTIPPLQGPASSFDKVRGKSFTMDAPGQTLTLQVTPSDAFTMGQRQRDRTRRYRRQKWYFDLRRQY